MAKDTIIKKKLKRKGWSYREAAPVLGVTYEYLCRVCNGVHKSRRLTAKIFELPNAPKFRRAPRRPKNLSTKTDER